MYLTYARYKELGGELEQAPFTILEYKSRKQIDRYSYNRLVDGVPDNIKNEIELAMMNLIKYNETNVDNNLNSETIDGYSVTYGNAKEQEDKIKALVEDLLVGLTKNGTPLTYAGGLNDYKRTYYPIS